MGLLFRANNTTFVVMKRFVLILLATLCGVWVLGIDSLAAQSVVVGARAPRLQGNEWLTDSPDLKGKALLVEFFHSTNQTCRERIEPLNNLGNRFKEQLNVVVVVREPREQVVNLLLHEYQYFYIALDEQGSIFRTFEVRYVPYAVLMDHRGNILWTGNSSQLTDSVIDKYINIK